MKPVDIQQVVPMARRQLAPLYLLYGDEPLLVLETADAIRVLAKKAGCSERVVIDLDEQFDAGMLVAEAMGGSLFAEKRLLELRAQAKPKRGVSDALVELAQHAGEALLVLITVGSLDARAKWVAALARKGVVACAWPVRRERMAAWLRQRARDRGVQLDAAAVDYLCDAWEGNLLGLAQQLDKLGALFGDRKIGTSEVAASGEQGSRFDLFRLSDAVVAGDIPRAQRILRQLRAEGAELVPIVAILYRELRLLAALSRADDPAAVWRGVRTWPARQRLFDSAVRRHRPAAIERALATCTELDQQSKGFAAGRPWETVEHMILELRG